ncbi:hypothetical protein FNV43_RR10713 [Rhamnella rubrinervis]|uniref:VQ domain-containing protein n=1 Tax=Rhamnella rubrinervis TaxID=2594499 RepID=A0A8K0MH28_9ROSA|nr:hypothetical protein FNV43_RR10713 [Rhamnella rubrinervis]
MDSSDYHTAGRSPRKELLGPRPTPLKVHKDSHKIKKPPVAPQQSQPPANPPRQPVIIYTVSPKIIHTKPSDFMNLVQRLTGLSSSSTSSSTSSTMSSEVATGNSLNDINSGAISPAARYATIEKARPPRDQGKVSQMSGVVEGMEMDDHHGHGHGHVDQKCLFPGILSPGPASLPPIAPNFFSPPSDSFFHDLSPVLHGNRNFMEGSFMPSPSYFISPHITSPNAPSIDLFNNFSDL